VQDKWFQGARGDQSSINFSRCADREKGLLRRESFVPWALLAFPAPLSTSTGAFSVKEIQFWRLNPHKISSNRIEAVLILRQRATNLPVMLFVCQLFELPGILK
jgi:hypothetical protein